MLARHQMGEFLRTVSGHASLSEVATRELSTYARAVLERLGGTSSLGAVTRDAIAALIASPGLTLADLLAPQSADDAVTSHRRRARHDRVAETVAALEEP